MGRKPLPASSLKKPFNLLLDEPLRAALEEAAAANGRTVTDEIRQRLERTLLEDEKFDEPTQGLGFAIMELAASIQRQSANGVAWHQHPRAFEALKQSMLTWLDGAKLTEPGPVPFDDDPVSFGKAIGLALLFQMRGSEELYRRLGRGLRWAAAGFTGVSDSMKGRRLRKAEKKEK
jgi:hypothetical protein